MIHCLYLYDLSKPFLPELLRSLTDRGFLLYNFLSPEELSNFDLEKSELKLAVGISQKGRNIVNMTNYLADDRISLPYPSMLYSHPKFNQITTRRGHAFVFSSLMPDDTEFHKKVLFDVVEMVSRYLRDNSIRNQVDLNRLYALDRENWIKTDKKLVSLEFDKEYKQAGLQILNYFQETLNQKYPDNDVTVRIGQKGNTITMEIETPDGRTELYERALEEYGLVVTGQMPVEDYLENPLDQAGLHYKLEIAHAELNMNTKLMAAKDQVIENQKEQLARQDQSLIYFREQLSLATRANRFALKEFSTVAKTALEKNDPVELFKWMDRVLSNDGPEALEAQLETTKEEDPTLYQTILTRANAVVDGAATKVMSAGLIEFFRKLIENG